MEEAELVELTERHKRGEIPLIDRYLPLSREIMIHRNLTDNVLQFR